MKIREEFYESIAIKWVEFFKKRNNNKKYTIIKESNGFNNLGFEIIRYNIYEEKL